ncbi:hypothetical protein GGD64_007704 [Bradyrhizobium sp. CIR3A]|nr:hypothetical protein [Bradyrhizobium sp. CIR3A]
MKLLEQLKTSRPDRLSKKLPDDAFVMLDPAVEVLDAEIAEHRLLSHNYLEIGMVVPPGDGLVDFVTALSNEPVNVAVLRAEFDDQSLIDEMLASLRQHGFMHITSQTKPSAEELEHLRRAAESARTASLRRSIVIDLDAESSLEQISTRLKDETHPPELVLRCAQPANYKLILGELARLRQKGIVRMHQTVVQTQCLSSDSALRRSLIRLGAAVYLDGISWPAPNDPIAGLEEMVRDCVAVYLLMTPDLSIMDEAERRRVLTWATSAFISGLCLRLDPEALWPGGDAAEADFDAAFNAVRAIENALGDVLIVNLPSDEVLLGNAASSASSGRVSDFAKRFRSAYLRWRLPLLKACENDNSWSQVPEVEDKLVRAQEDLLPNHPELLLLKPGSIVVDVCGGLGRVARRLSPAVGEDGLVISVEMFRCLSGPGP